MTIYCGVCDLQIVFNAICERVIYGKTTICKSKRQTKLQSTDADELDLLDSDIRGLFSLSFSHRASGTLSLPFVFTNRCCFIDLSTCCPVHRDFHIFVTKMDYMFYSADDYTQTLCGNTWIESTASKIWRFNNAGTNAKIGTVPCLYNACRPGKYLTPKTCSDCTNGKYQNKIGFKESSCKLCPRGNSSTSGSTSCDLTTVKMPNGCKGKDSSDRTCDTRKVVDELISCFSFNNGRE